jgi:hypothetical protein
MLRENMVAALRDAALVSLGAALLAVSGASSVQAASPKLTITNTTAPVEIPLLQGSSVEIDAQGDLLVQCALTNGACPSVGGTGTGSGPTSVTLTPSALAITAGGNFSLSWGSSSGTEVCYGAGPDGLASWSGVALPPSGSRAVSLATAGEYVFQVRCYTASGSTTQLSAPVVVSVATTPPPPVGTNYCSEFYDGVTRPVPTSPNFTAFGFTKVEKTMQSIWGISPGQASTTRAGIPGNHLNPSANHYLAIPFTMTDDSGSWQSHFMLDWIEANNTVAIPSGSIAVTISPCPGDFRKATGINATDPYLSTACRRFESPTTIGSLSVSSASQLSGCPAPKGKLMYLNFATYDMSGPSAPTETTCPGTSTCGVSMIVN